jgi:hypothetical protein
MGVYSEMAAEQLNEQNMLDNFKFTDLLEFSVDLERADQAMFDAMLEMDFHEAFCESGLIYLSEEEKASGIESAIGKMKEKLVALINKFVEMIKTAVAKIMNALAELTERNKALVAKIGKLNKNEFRKLFADYPKKGEIKITNVKEGFDDEVKAAFKKLSDIQKDANNDKRVLAIKDGIRGTVEDAVSDAANNYSSYFEVMTAAEFIKTRMFANLYNALKTNDPGMVATVSREVENAKKTAQMDIKALKADKKTADGDESRELVNAKIAVYSAVSAGYSKLLSVCANFVARRASAYRSAYAKMGAIKGATLSAKEELAGAKTGAKNAGKLASEKARETGETIRGGAKKISDRFSDMASDIKTKAGKLLKKKHECGAIEYYDPEEYQYMSEEDCDLAFTCFAIDTLNEAYIDELFA